MKFTHGLLAAVLLLAGCGADATESTGATNSTDATESTVVDPDRPAVGSVVDRQPLTDLDPSLANAVATKVTYRSTSGIDDRPTEVTGTVFVPQGEPPQGGWPIVTVGHGTTGVTDDCAPSSYPDFLGADRAVATLLARGWVVALSDYQGLGTPDPHPYLEPRTAAFNLIDAVRAARAVEPRTSNRWAALGISQGGQASWAAAEQAGAYGAGLQFVGSANLSPPADLTASVPQTGQVNLTLPQVILYPMVIAGLQVSHPDLDPGAYLHGKLGEQKDAFVGCAMATTMKASIALSFTPADYQPAGQADADRIHGWLRERALPQERAAGPMLVVAGANDNLVLTPWVETATANACARGDVVALHVRPNEGHADAKALPEMTDWLADRFADLPAPNTCGG